MEHLVTNGGLGLQAAIDLAEWGDVITVNAGTVLSLNISFADYFTPYILRNKGVPAQGQQILIRSSLPIQGRSTGSTNTFKIHATQPRQKVMNPGGLIATETNAQGWKIVGAELTDNGASGVTCNNLVVITDGARDIHLDQCYLHPSEDGTTELERQVEVGVTIGSSFTGGGRTTSNVKLTRSRLSGFGGCYPGSQEVMNSMPIQSGIVDGLAVDDCFLGGALQSWFPGPIDPFNVKSASVRSATLTSATLEHVTDLKVGDYVAFTQENPNHFACGKVLSMAGTDITFTSLHPDYNQVAADIPRGICTWGGEVGRNYTVTHNTFYLDPVLAKAIKLITGSSPKGYIEFKSGEYAKLIGNVFDGYPSVIAVNSANQNGGCPWTGTDGLTIADNWIKHAGSAFNLQFGNSEGLAGIPICKASKDILIENNLIGSPEDDTYWGMISGGRNVKVRHNTIVGNPKADQNALFVVSDSPGFEWADNVYNAGQSVNGKGFNQTLPTGVEKKNLVANNTAGLSNPRTNEIVQSHFPASYVVPSIPFVGSSPEVLTDWALTQQFTGSDGKQVGADIPRLAAALAGTVGPTPPIPTPPATRTVAWPTTEGGQNQVVATQWADGFYFFKNLSGKFAEFRKP